MSTPPRELFPNESDPSKRAFFNGEKMQNGTDPLALAIANTSVPTSPDSVQNQSAVSAALTAIGIGGPSLSASNTAAQNLAAIQTALNLSGKISIATPGTFLISDSLRLKDNSDIYVGPLTTIKLADNVNKNPIVTQAYADFLAGLGKTVISLTASGLIGTANVTAHGYAVGDYVAHYGINEANYNGVFRVVSVADADHYTFKFYHTPTVTTATGTIKSIKANTNIKLTVDGWIDVNAQNNGTAAGDVPGCGILMGFVYDYELRYRVKNCWTRAWMPICARKGFAEGVIGEQSYVSTQTIGPVQGLVVGSLGGGSIQDDLCAIMDRNGPNFAGQDQWITWGDLQGIIVNGPIDGGGDGSGANSGKPIAIYSESGVFQNDVVVRNVFGSQVQGTNGTASTLSCDGAKKQAATTLSADSATKQFRDSANGFVAANFAVGQKIRTTIGSNTNVYTITAVTAGVITVAETVSTQAAGGSYSIWQIGRYEQVKLEHWAIAATKLISSSYIDVGKLIFDDIEILTDDGTFKNQYFFFDTTTFFREKEFINVRHDKPTAPGGFSYLIYDQSANTDEVVTLRDCRNSVYLTALYARVSSGCKKILFENCHAGTKFDGSAGWLFWCNTGLTIGEVIFDKCVGANSSGKAVFNSGCDITMRNCIQEYCNKWLNLGDNSNMTFNVTLSGHNMANNNAGDVLMVLNGNGSTTGATVNVYGEFVPPVGCSLATIVAGSVLNPKSLGIRLDVSTAGVGKGVGNLAYHTGATNPGPAYADGTNWRRMYDAAIIV